MFPFPTALPSGIGRHSGRKIRMDLHLSFPPPNHPKGTHEWHAVPACSFPDETGSVFQIHKTDPHFHPFVHFLHTMCLSETFEPTVSHAILDHPPVFLHLLKVLKNIIQAWICSGYLLTNRLPISNACAKSFWNCSS